MKIYFMLMIVVCFSQAIVKSEQSCFFYIAAGLFAVARAICELR